MRRTISPTSSCNPRAPRSTLFPYTTLFRSVPFALVAADHLEGAVPQHKLLAARQDVLVFLRRMVRSEEHTSELQSRVELVCRLLLEKKNGNCRFLYLRCGTVLRGRDSTYSA